MRTLCALLLCMMAACSSKDDDLYNTCEQPDDCAVPEEAEAVCLDKSGVGFCSWTCGGDQDCEGSEDDDVYDFVCASFESNEGLYCFPSCEEVDEDAENGGCPAGYGCRSTGGGSDNRKICFPEG